jgi:hypothetical protein
MLATTAHDQDTLVDLHPELEVVVRARYVVLMSHILIAKAAKEVMCSGMAGAVNGDEHSAGRDGQCLQVTGWST